MQRKNIHSEHDKDQAWTAAAAKAKTYGDDMIKRWNSEIDFYLLFVGVPYTPLHSRALTVLFLAEAALFSAILTAFNVQSYQLLQPTPGPDPTTVVLQHIAQQLSSFSINPPFLNSTHSSNLPIRVQAGDSMPPVPRSAIWLNILWFSSLILSLASSVIGILVKQWLNEYSWSSGSSREAARLRQYRLDNLLKWHVGGFIVAIPVLLLLSLGLFLAGLLLLLWTLHPAVALVASVLVGCVAVITAAVTVLPLFDDSCAYLSPQTLALFSACSHFRHRILTPIGNLFLKVANVVWPWFQLQTPGSSTIQYTSSADKSNSNRARQAHSVLTWREREQFAIHESGYLLDVKVLTMAYETTLDTDAISTATICLPDLPSHYVLDYFVNLHESITRHVGSTEDKHRHPHDETLVYHALLCALDLHAAGGDLYQELCDRSWSDGLRYLPPPQHYAPSRAQGGAEVEWLHSAASWLERWIQNTTDPIWDLEDSKSLIRLESHCQALSSERQIAR